MMLFDDAWFHELWCRGGRGGVKRKVQMVCSGGRVVWDGVNCGEYTTETSKPAAEYSAFNCTSHISTAHKARTFVAWGKA